MISGGRETRKGMWAMPILYGRIVALGTFILGLTKNVPKFQLTNKLVHDVGYYNMIRYRTAEFRFLYRYKRLK
jgi:hypothetical protein